MNIPPINQKIEGNMARIVNNIADNILKDKENTPLDKTDLQIDITNIQTLPDIISILGLEPTEENLMYIKRLGLFISGDLRKLLTFLQEDDKQHILEQIKAFAVPLDEAEGYIQNLSEGDIIDTFNNVDYIMYHVKDEYGEYIDLYDRIKANDLANPKTNSYINIKEHLQNLVDLASDFNIPLTSENIVLLDKLYFVFGKNTEDIIKNLDQSNLEHRIEKILKQPEMLFKIYETAYENAGNKANNQEVWQMFINIFSNYVKLFPLAERQRVLDIWYRLLTNNKMDQTIIKNFEDNAQKIKKHTTKMMLYRRIHGDMAGALERQTKDTFPFLFVPLFIVYDEKIIFGEMWTIKNRKDNNQKNKYYSVFLWSDISKIGRIETSIQGIDKTINVKFFSQPQIADIMDKNKDSIIQIFNRYKFNTNSIMFLPLKDQYGGLNAFLNDMLKILPSLDIKI